jgi:hypothetical protein
MKGALEGFIALIDGTTRSADVDQHSKEFLEQIESLGQHVESKMDVTMPSNDCPDYDTTRPHAVSIILAIDHAQVLCGEASFDRGPNCEGSVFTCVLHHLVDYPLACTIISTSEKLKTAFVPPSGSAGKIPSPAPTLSHHTSVEPA